MSLKKEKNIIAPEKLKLYDKLIGTNPNIERKGDTMPYTSLKGHMFTFLSKTGSLGIRLPKDERENFLKNFNTTLCEAHGVIMKEYVLVPDALLRNTNVLKKYLDLSYGYIKTLKPKPAKRSKAAK